MQIGTTPLTMRRSLVALAIVCAALGLAPRQRPPRPQDVVHNLLDAYDSGRHSEVLAQLRSTSDLRGLLQQFRHASEQWATSADLARRQSRRFSAAVLFLEAGRVAIESPTVYTEWRKDLEHYCDLLLAKEFPPSLQRLWLLASVSLLHGVRDAVLLAGEQNDPRRYNSTSGHAYHARSRFGDESRFALAPVIARREVNLVANKAGTPARFLAFHLVRLPDFGLVDASQDRLAATINDLTQLSRDERVGEEAHLRLGILAFHLGRVDESAVYLQAAAGPAGDVFVRHLAHLTRGLMLDAAGQETQAESALRAAVEVSPNAQSGVMALAARLFRSGQREEAAVLMDRLATTTEASDPWREYSFGDLRFWPKYQAELRQMLMAMNGR